MFHEILVINKIKGANIIATCNSLQSHVTDAEFLITVNNTL